MKIEDACPTCGALCEVDLDADEEEYVAIDVAARATAEQRDSVIEECAKVCDNAEVSYNVAVRKETASFLALMIRALKSQQDAAIESQRSGDGS